MNTLTAGQIRAARAMLRMDQAELARRAGVSVETIKRLERMEGPVQATEETVGKIWGALGEAGIDFMDESDMLGAGVHLRKERMDWTRIAVHHALGIFLLRWIEETYRRHPDISDEGVERIVDALIDTLGRERKNLETLIADVIERDHAWRAVGAPGSA